MSGPLIVSGGRFELGRALGEGGRMLRGRWGALLLALALFAWVPQIVANLAYLAIALSGGRRTAAVVIAGLVNLGAPLVMRAVATAVVLGPPGASIGAATGAALKAAPALAPVWLISLAPGAAALALGFVSGGFPQLGWLLAIIAWPLGLAVAAVLGVYTPVVLAERLGPLAAARRSFNLLSGSRWKFVALYLLLQLLADAPRFAANLLARVHGAADAHLLYFSEQIGGLFAQDAVLTWWSVVAVAVYLELARARDGLAPGDVVEVFA